MPQSLAKVIVHIVYSTKHRQPWLHNPVLRSELNAYAATILKNDVDSPAILINGMADHLHILCLLSRKFAIMDVIKKQGTTHNDFQWQAGYGIFSVSQSNVEQVKRYIAKQEERHKRMSFQDEFREICKRHGIGVNERYVWN